MEDVSQTSNKILNPTSLEKNGQTFNKIAIFTSWFQEQSNQFWTKIVDQCFIVFLNNVMNEDVQTVGCCLLSHFITSTWYYCSQRFIEYQCNCEFILFARSTIFKHFNNGMCTCFVNYRWVLFQISGNLFNDSNNSFHQICRLINWI